MPSKSRKTFCQLVQEGCGEAGASHLVPAAYRARFREAERTIAVLREALESGRRRVRDRRGERAQLQTRCAIGPAEDGLIG
jgi:hypothetical protein